MTQTDISRVLSADPAELEPAERQKLAAELAAQIEEHREAYYVHDAPKISDKEFDELVHALEDLESAYPELARDDSPTQKVGGYADTEAFAPVQHVARMYSLEDVFSVEELDLSLIHI